MTKWTLREAEIRRDEKLLEHFGWTREQGLRGPVFRRGNQRAQLDARDWVIYVDNEFAWRDRELPLWALEHPDPETT